MEHAGVKRFITDSMYQHKEEEIFPTLEVSADSVKTLKDMKFNSLFPITATVRIIGVNEKEITPGRKETYYSLELRELGIEHTDTEDMSPEEIRDKIEQTVEEKSDNA